MGEVKNVPKLRFEDYSGEWKEIKYNEIFSFYTTNSLSRDKLNYYDGEVYNIHYGDIHTKFSTLFDLKFENIPFINEDVDLNKVKDESYCKVGDLVIADASEDYNDIGKTIEIVNLNGQKTLAGLHTFLARPNKMKLAIGFSGYLMQSSKVRKQIMTIAQGTKVLSLSTTRLGLVNLNLPTLPEQKKIANFLTAVDAKISNLSEEKSLLEQYKKGVMQKIFAQELRFKQDDGSDFPEWENSKFSKFIKLYRGSSPRPIIRFIAKKNGVNWIKIGDTKRSNIFILDNAEEQITNEGSLKSRMVKAGELILANSMSFGKTYLLKIDGCIYDGWFVLREYERNFNKSFLLQLLNSQYMQKQYIRLSTGGVVQNISSEIVYSTKIFKPSIPEQVKIANFLSAIDEKIATVSEALEGAQAFKKGLLQQLFV